ncbi:MAG TPA: RNA chaperone Hfq [Acidobacteriaceae bacterium]|nr:RNA chaperone Hfq [Acidobacteriaceae bacterium]
MNTPGSGRRKQKSHHPQSETGQEAMYLRTLSERQTPVVVQLRDGEALQGWIEYFDDHMIRLTREAKPNLFIYKHQILTITEKARRPAPRRDKPFEAEESTEESQA